MNADTPPLGQRSVYPKAYDPGILFPIERQTAREELGLQADALPFAGVDLWTAFELAWIGNNNKPEVGIARFCFDCTSAYIIESKSLKLYLAGLSYRYFKEVAEVQQCLEADLSQAVGSPVRVVVVPASEFKNETVGQLKGLLLDSLKVDCEETELSPEVLKADTIWPPLNTVFISHLLKSLCPITGQPDWASVQIGYQGYPIDPANLLRYLVSFREHAIFHENCVERIFTDIWDRCHPDYLTVYARYNRRGGIDINPFRTSHPDNLPPFARLARQ